MPLIAIRILAVLLAIGTAAPVALGMMADPLFVVPDYLVAALLVAAALLPERWARPLLIAAFAFTLGVFSIAAASRLQGDGLTPLLALAVLMGLAGLVGLITRRG